MESSLSLPARNFTVADGELFIGRLPATTLAKKYGTPAFLYDRTVLDAKLASLRNALPSRFAIYYSVKANPNPAIVRHFVSRGCGLEVASRGEFLLALQSGADPRRIVFAGPGKTYAELEFVLLHGIGEIHVESLTEIGRIREICRRQNLTARVAVRVNPTGEAEGGAMRMGGRAAPFGVDEEALDAVLDTLLSDPAIDFRGIHLFAGTQILDANVLVDQYRHGIQLAKRVAKRTGHPLHTVDLGGGLGIPYFPHEKELELDLLRQRLSELFAELDSDPLFRGTEFLVEPGRFLVGDSGIYVASVIDIKESRGTKFLIVDGGMNHHLAASGNLGQTIKRNYPVALLNKLDAPAEETVNVVGPLCTPLDTLARSVALPKAEIGDLFAIFQSGAYARTASPSEFLSHPTPAEILVDGDNAELITPRRESSYATPDLVVPVSVSKG